MSEERREAKLEELEAVLGHVFGQRRLLLRALTHRSLAHEQMVKELAVHEHAESGKPVEALPPVDNERLEFLGDAVLGLAVGEALFHQHPEWQEGELTRIRSRLVSRQVYRKATMG